MEFEGGGQIDGPLTIASLEAVQCALTALRDDTAGWISWSHSTTDTAGTIVRAYRLDLVGGRFALSQVRLDNIGGAPQNMSSYALSGPVALAEVAFFDACLQETEPEAILGCFEDALEPCP